jgi:uncharacterized protein (DUF488 family)
MTMITNNSTLDSTKEKQEYDEYDFYTIGHSKQDISVFIEKLKNVGVKTLVNVRYNPTGGQWTSQFNEDVLKLALEKAGIEYIHKKELGVPADQRQNLNTKKGRQKLWDWYDNDVIPKQLENIVNFLNERKQSNMHPVVFMCVEKDFTRCHRHRIAIALEDIKGMRGLDL